MTTTVKIKNNGPDRINVNEVDRLPRDQERTAFSHTLAVGEEIELRVWGANRYLCVLETNDTDAIVGRAALNELERVMAKWTRISLAAKGVVEAKTSTYRARNGRDVGVQDERGEKCWIVPFEEMDLLQAVLEADETPNHNPPDHKM